MAEERAAAAQHSVLVFSAAAAALYLVSWVRPDPAPSSESRTDSEYAVSSPATTARLRT